jgi:hypothetical protein
MEFAKVSRKYCNILFRQDGCFRGSTAELLCVTGDATACEQVAGAMPFLTSNRFQIEEIEREREKYQIKTLENRRFRVSMSDTKILVPIAVLEDHGRNLGLEIFGLEIYALVVERCKVAP